MANNGSIPEEQGPAIILIVPVGAIVVRVALRIFIAWSFLS